MLFSSLTFLFLYLPVVLCGYFAVPFVIKRLRRDYSSAVDILDATVNGKAFDESDGKAIAVWRNVWLFIVSLTFYGWGEPKYIIVMLATILLNYAAGLFIEKQLSPSAEPRADLASWESRRRKAAKRILASAVIVDLLILVAFKYLDLFLTTFGLEPVGLELPIGISFYMFQCMSYPIDVYRNDCKAQRSYVRFGLFVTLFPQLIAGPIVRYKDIAAQLDNRRETPSNFALGAERFTVGLAKKVLLANNIGALWDYYKALESPSALGAWLGIIAFSFQIYFDFSGYSDMAIGLGKMFGFKFLENFNYPYISDSVTEFWRRWHISLSTWFRDYVYIPLGGNRKGKARQLLNIAIVWTLTGFWHGASWNFLIWGFYYAILLIAEKTFLLPLLDKLPKPLKPLRHVYTLLAVVLGWALFALDDKAALGLGSYLAAMFGANGGVTGVDLYQLREYAVTLVVLAFASLPLWRSVAVLLAVRLSASRTASNRPNRIDQLERVFTFVKPLLVLFVLILCTAYLVNSGYNPFLYFRF